MSEEEHKQPPKTIAEVGIHVGYLREDVGEIKDILKDLQNRAVLQSDFDDYKTAQEKEHTEMWKAINKKPVVSSIIWSLFSALLTAVVVYEITSNLWR